MFITAEISLYPLCKGYGKYIIEFLHRLKQYENIEIQTTIMSTTLSGTYEDIMDVLTKEIKPAFEKHDAVFTIKIANACGI
jgi:uncharacterized protein YqgV (UPF0045/DUF77 family)